MVDKDLGEATIVYEDPDDGTVERTVQNEHVAYFQDHWMVKTGEDDQGRDIARRIPSHRVYYVERSVERFEEEIKTVRHQVQSLTDDLRSKILGSGGGSSGTEESRRIDVDTSEDVSGTSDADASEDVESGEQTRDGRSNQ